MADLIRRFRGLGIAFVVVALSAGVVFAGAPKFALVNDDEPTVELPTSETPTSETPTDEGGDEDSDEDSDEDGDEDAGADADGALVEEADGNHGALVSSAAQASTPPGFRNHGAFVSCVARWHKNAEAPAITDPTLLTPEDCGLEATPGPEAGATDDGSGEDVEAEALTGKAKGQAKAQAAKVKAEGSKGKGKAKHGR